MKIAHARAGLLTACTLALFITSHAAFADGWAVTVAAPSTVTSVPATEARWLFASQLDLSKSQPEGKPTPPAANAPLQWFSYSGPTDPIWNDVKAKPTMTDEHTATLPVLRTYEDRREFIYAPETIVIAYIYEPASGSCTANVPTINLVETPRQRAISIELSSIAKEFNTTVTTKGIYCMVVKSQTLLQDRATLDLTVNVGDTKVGDTDVLTGTREPFFFTADGIYSGLAQVDFDQSTGNLKGKQAPNNPLIGFNWMPTGDPYKVYDSSDVSEHLAVKLLASSSSPKKDFGLGLGYVIKAGVFNTTDKTNSFMVFVCYMQSTGNTGIRTYSWRWGLSYNFGAFGGTGGS